MKPNRNREVVIGPGHSLNELVSRLLFSTECYNYHSEWQLYPGVFGLYARHDDDWVAQNRYRSVDQQILAQYNLVVRDATTAEPINNFLRDHFYVNMTYDCMENIYRDVKPPIYSSYLDMKNFPETRYHFAMQEFSEGSAIHINYNKAPTIKEICRRIRIKNDEETHARNTLEVNWVCAGKLLQKDYSDLSDDHQRFIEDFDPIIDEYHHYNRITDFSMLQLVDMTWEEIVDNSYK